ncbi:hypothetical protein [Methanoregula sp.]|jgi:hypothetical protein|uniref:hypothetical protein n=1 Tax=Methanoregula sp. TaxID=2052170 RepID=UPI003C193D17
MTRGRLPVRAWEKAEPIAEMRERVQHFLREPGGICDFEILSPGLVSHIKIACVRRLRCPMAEIGRELVDEIAEMRLIASSKEISRELWLCSPRYTFRFIRVLDSALAELGRDGSLLPAAAPGA